jgi:chromosome partitioning protein
LIKTNKHINYLKKIGNEKMKKTIFSALVNPKGGVTKSTSVVNIAAAAALRGKRVLLVDFDPQGTATDLCGFDELSQEMNIDKSNHSADLIVTEEKKPSELAVKTKYGFDLIPSSSALYMLDSFIKETPMGEMVLAGVLSRDDGLNVYDHVFFDTQGAPTAVLASVIAAANDVVIPTLEARDSTAEIEKQLIPMINKISNANLMFKRDAVNIRGIFFAISEPNTRIHKYQKSNMVDKYPDLFLSDIFIEKSTDVKVVSEGCAPIVAVMPDHKISKQYIALFDKLYTQGNK